MGISLCIFKRMGVNIMYANKIHKNQMRSADHADKSTSYNRNMPNSLMNSMVNSDAAMEREADRVSEEVGAKYNRLDEIKSVLGSRLGVDFSDVQFHTDAAADRAAEGYNAKAFTKGSDIYLGSEGMNSAIAAHELVHTIQQGAVSGGDTMSAPSGQVQLWGKKKTTPGNSSPLDLKKMNFGKKAYKSDADYQNLEQLMKNYNESGSMEAKAALMESAMQYIDKNSRGEQAKHKGRTKKAEQLLFQLTMGDGQRAMANENIDRIQGKDGSGLKVDPKKIGNHDLLRKESNHVLGDIRNAVNGKGFSKATSMITANVMADQGKTDFMAGSSGSYRVYKDDDPDNYRYHVGGRADTSSTANNSIHMDNVGTTLHEFTHASVGESYDNTRMFISADKDASDEELLARRDDRVNRINELLESGKNLNISTKQGKYNSALVKDRASYGLGKKMALYKNNLLGCMSDQKKSLSGDKLNKVEKEGQQMEHINGLFASEDQKYAKKYMSYSDKMKTIQDKKRGLKEGTAEHGRLQKQYDELRKQQEEEGKKSSHSDALVEYDPVINQMLIQYEMATKDRSSQHYRQLKAAALRAHVDRSLAKMKRQS